MNQNSHNPNRSHWIAKHTGSLLVLLACMIATSAGADESGRLIIVGGALKPEHAEIYEAFLDDLDDRARIGVIPLASGVPERSGPLTVQDIAQYVGKGHTVFDTELTKNRPEYAATKTCAELLGGCAALWFTGGDQSRIVSAMRPKAGDTKSYKEVVSLLRRGGTVGGTSAGAAMMSTTMIRGGSSQDAMLLGASKQEDGLGVWVGQGMGLFEYGIVDQHFLRRGRFGRLLAAMEASNTLLGFGVSENRAISVDRATDRITTIGSRALTVIDRSDSERDGYKRTNVRVHLLGSSDQINGGDQEVTIASNKTELGPPSQDIGVSISFYDVWDPYVIADMISALAANPNRPVISYDRNYEYRMSADKETRFYVGSEESGGLSAVAVRLDIVPRQDLAPIVTERRRELAASEDE